MSTQSPPRPERPLLVVISSGILLVLSLLAILAILAALYRWLADKGIFYPDFALPMLLLAGIVLFFGAIAVLVNVYRSVRLNDPGHALGLPEGSVRAIIALILIFLFFVAITFIYSSMLREGRDRNLQGLTPAQFAQLPTAELLSSTPIPATGTPTSYDVVLRATVSPAAQDVGKNLIVLLGTLVTAVAAFYFGSNSATSAVAVGKQISSGGETSRAAPQVVSIAPTRGGPTGGTPVVLSGSGFTDATAVNFGPNAAQRFTFDSDAQITAVSPAGSGSVNITVTTPAGVSPQSQATQFTYSVASPPQVDAVRPAEGPTAGGTPVVLSGSGFTDATAVNFGPNAAQRFTFDSDAQITAVSPAGSGSVNITVTTPAGVSPQSQATQFTYS